MKKKKKTVFDNKNKTDRKKEEKKTEEKSKLEKKTDRKQVKQKQNIKKTKHKKQKTLPDLNNITDKRFFVVNIFKVFCFISHKNRIVSKIFFKKKTLSISSDDRKLQKVSLFSLLIDIILSQTLLHACKISRPQ